MALMSEGVALRMCIVFVCGIRGTLEDQREYFLALVVERSRLSYIFAAEQIATRPYRQTTPAGRS